MSEVPQCPQCNYEYCYEDRSMYVCPECNNEWTVEATTAASDAGFTVVDANGNTLANGDSVSVIKNLKVKGTSSVVKVGTKVKNIRLVDSDHNIDCKIPDIGQMKLKSEFVRKA